MKSCASKKNKKNHVLFTLVFLVVCILGGSSYAEVDIQQKTYKFAGDYNFPPYEYKNSEGNFIGFNVDIVRSIAKTQDIKIEVIPMEWNVAVSNLEDGKIDGIIGMSRSEAREEKFIFTTPTIGIEQVIFVEKDNVFINNIEDLEGLLVGYQISDLGQAYLEDINRVIPIPYKDQESAIMDLSDGKVDAVIGNKLAGTYYIQKNNLNENIKITGDTLEYTDYGLAVGKENIELAQILEKGLKDIKDNNAYDNIYKKWFGDRRSRLFEFLYKNRFILFTTTGFGFLIIVFLISHNRILKKQVDKRTHQLKQANDDILKSQSEIYNLAYYDSITGLPNRSHFVKELGNIFKNIKKEKQSFAVLFLDLDKFKHINDTLGHNIGDEVLQLLSIRLKKLLGESRFLSKAGGDEYFILMTDIKDNQEVLNLAEDIIEDFKDPYYINDYKLYLTTSIGIAIYPEAGVDTNDIVKSADLALYKAKEFGGNSYYIYGKEIKSKGLDKMILLNELRQGIENDELILYYQPQIDINTNKLIGFEALVRWEHPIKGMIPPDDFIPLAEETGLIIPMGNTILNKACRQAKQWIEDGYEMIISVNISAKQFQHTEFLKKVQEVLKSTGLNPKYLTIEITETTAISNISYTLNLLKELNKLGITISIDDFGTGYSSLSYLNEMNVDELKIDRSFIWDIEKNCKNESISNAIIVLAKQLGIKVTAEGVENEEQLSLLKEMKCDTAQGYYFSKPVPKEEVSDIIKAQLSINNKN